MSITDGRRGHIASTYDNGDRLQTAGATAYTYTPNGELLTKMAVGRTTTYDYDALGNLRTITLPNASVISYVIDGRNRRVGENVDGTLQRGWMDADQLRPVAELAADGSIAARFVYGTRSNVPSLIQSAA